MAHARYRRVVALAPRLGDRLLHWMRETGVDDHLVVMDWVDMDRAERGAEFQQIHLGCWTVVRLALHECDRVLALSTVRQSRMRDCHLVQL